jgi:hypothetical protein
VKENASFSTADFASIAVPFEERSSVRSAQKTPSEKNKKLQTNMTW